MDTKEENKKEPYNEDYERPRCKVLLQLPFGLFVARHVTLKLEKAVSEPNYEL